LLQTSTSPLASRFVSLVPLNSPNAVRAVIRRTASGNPCSQPYRNRPLRSEWRVHMPSPIVLPCAFSEANFTKAFNR